MQEISLKITDDQLLKELKDFGVPIKESVMLLCRLKKVSMQQIISSAGYSRNGLLEALTAARRPKKALCQSVINHLGVDPWAVYEEDHDQG